MTGPQPDQRSRRGFSGRAGNILARRSSLDNEGEPCVADSLNAFVQPRTAPFAFNRVDHLGDLRWMMTTSIPGPSGSPLIIPAVVRWEPSLVVRSVYSVTWRQERRSGTRGTNGKGSRLH